MESRYLHQSEASGSFVRTKGMYWSLYKYTPPKMVENLRLDSDFSNPADYEPIVIAQWAAIAVYVVFICFGLLFICPVFGRANVKPFEMGIKFSDIDLLRPFRQEIPVPRFKAWLKNRKVR